MKPDCRFAIDTPVPLQELCEALRNARPSLLHDRPAHKKWLLRQLEVCAANDVYRWFISRDLGGAGWSETAIVASYLALSQSCLTTTFVITQWAAAVRRLVISENRPLVHRLVADLLTGNAFTTVAISHLTTSRQHLGQPAMGARYNPDAGGYVLNGTSSWVTAAGLADFIVLGAVTDDGNQILVALPTDSPGVLIGEPQSLIALDASQTGPVQCRDAFVADEYLIAGPCVNVMQPSNHSGSGGLPTSTLAIGHAAAAIDYLESQGRSRPNLVHVTNSLRQTWQELVKHLMNAASGNPDLPQEELRSRANSLVLRATQAALVAAKGAGFALGIPSDNGVRKLYFFWFGVALKAFNKQTCVSWRPPNSSRGQVNDPEPSALASGVIRFSHRIQITGGWHRRLRIPNDSRQRTDQIFP